MLISLTLVLVEVLFRWPDGIRLFGAANVAASEDYLPGVGWVFATVAMVPDHAIAILTSEQISRRIVEASS